MLGYSEPMPAVGELEGVVVCGQAVGRAFWFPWTLSALYKTPDPVDMTRPLRA